MSVPNKVQKGTHYPDTDIPFCWCQRATDGSLFCLLEMKPSFLLSPTRRTAGLLFTILFLMSQVLPGNKANKYCGSLGKSRVPETLQGSSTQRKSPIANVLTKGLRANLEDPLTESPSATYLISSLYALSVKSNEVEGVSGARNPFCSISKNEFN